MPGDVFILESNRPKHYAQSLLLNSLSAEVPLSTSPGALPPILADSTVLSSRWEPIAGSENRVQFYLDRVDISNPGSPQVLPSVQVPGSLISYDPASQHIVTVDYRIVRSPGKDQAKCYQAVGNWAEAWYHFDGCIGYHRSLKLLQLDGSQATLLDTLSLEGAALSNPALGTDRIFFLEYPGFYYWVDEFDSYGRPPFDTRNALLSIGGIAKGHFEKAPALPLTEGYGSYGLVYAQGTKAIVTTSLPKAVTVFEGSNLQASPVQLNRSELNTETLISDIDFTPSQAICSMAEEGVRAVSFSAH